MAAEEGRGQHARAFGPKPKTRAAQGYVGGQDRQQKARQSDYLFSGPPPLSFPPVFNRGWQLIVPTSRILGGGKGRAKGGTGGRERGWGGHSMERARSAWRACSRLQGGQENLNHTIIARLRSKGGVSFPIRCA